MVFERILIFVANPDHQHDLCFQRMRAVAKPHVVDGISGRTHHVLPSALHRSELSNGLAALVRSVELGAIYAGSPATDDGREGGWRVSTGSLCGLVRVSFLGWGGAHLYRHWQTAHREGIVLNAVTIDVHGLSRLILPGWPVHASGDDRAGGCHYRDDLRDAEIVRMRRRVPRERHLDVREICRIDWKHVGRVVGDDRIREERVIRHGGACYWGNGHPWGVAFAGNVRARRILNIEDRGVAALVAGAWRQRDGKADQLAGVPLSGCGGVSRWSRVDLKSHEHSTRHGLRPAHAHALRRRVVGNGSGFVTRMAAVGAVAVPRSLDAPLVVADEARRVDVDRAHVGVHAAGDHAACAAAAGHACAAAAGRAAAAAGRAAAAPRAAAAAALAAARADLAAADGAAARGSAVAAARAGAGTAAT